MSMLRRFFSTGEGATGAALLTLLALLALAAPLLFPRDPLAIVAAPLLHPFTDWAAPLGTDRLGRDLLAGLVHGGRTTLVIALAAAVMSLVFGAIVGTLAGFLGGLVDDVLMRLTDAFQIVPSFLLALAFVSIAGPSLAIVTLAIALGAWTGPARLVRAEILSIRERDHVVAARAIGMHPLAIAFREVLPQALPPLFALAAIIVAGAILTEAALSFLGLGDPNRVTWGAMIAEGRNVLRSAPWLSIAPGLALVITVLAVYLAGEGASEALTKRRILA